MKRTQRVSIKRMPSAGHYGGRQQKQLRFKQPNRRLDRPEPTAVDDPLGLSRDDLPEPPMTEKAFAARNSGGSKLRHVPLC